MEFRIEYAEETATDRCCQGLSDAMRMVRAEVGDNGVCEQSSVVEPGELVATFYRDQGDKSQGAWFARVVACEH